MGINDNYIKVLTDKAAKRGHNVRIRDIAYALLRYRMDDEIAYTVVFGVPEKENDVSSYESSDAVRYLVRTVSKDFEPKESKDDVIDLANLLSKEKNEAKSDEEDITFEENKAAMIELIRRTEDALADGKIETDKGLKIIADLRVKLNDKFNVADKGVQQLIFVQPKFNHICEYTRKECWLQTKEYAMEHWGLIEDPNKKQVQ